MLSYCQCVKSVRIRSYSGPYSVRMWENANQNNSEYGHFSCSAYICRLVALTHFPRINANIQCPSTLICFVCSWDDEIPPDEVFWETTPDYFGMIPLKCRFLHSYLQWSTILKKMFSFHHLKSTIGFCYNIIFAW